MGSMVLISLVHAKSGSVLIGQLELSLVALAFTTLCQCMHTTLLDTFTQVWSDVLSLVQSCATLLFILDAWEAVGIEQQVRLLLLLLNQSERRIAGAALLAVRRSRAWPAQGASLHVWLNLRCYAMVAWRLTLNGSCHGGHRSRSHILLRRE